MKPLTAKAPVTAKLTVRMDLSNHHWIEMSRHTFEENTQSSANFNWDDEIDSSLLVEALNKLEEAII